MSGTRRFDKVGPLDALAIMVLVNGIALIKWGRKAWRR